MAPARQASEILHDYFNLQMTLLHKKDINTLFVRVKQINQCNLIPFIFV